MALVLEQRTDQSDQSPTGSPTVAVEKRHLFARDRNLVAAIFLATLAIRAATAYFVKQPGFTDAFYYIDIARNVHAGRGFIEDFIWNYLEQPSAVTHPSNAYWGPLASVLLLPAFSLAGPTFRAAQLSMVLLSSALPLLSFATARHFSATRWQALLAALLTIFSGVYFAYWTVPDGAIPFSLAASVALLAMSRSLSGSWRWSALAGACVAVAQLARSDGILLLAVVLGTQAFLVTRRSGSLVSGLAHSLAAIATYAIVIAPWLFRNWAALGSPFYNPGLKTLFLREYNDVFAYGYAVDLSYYLSWELGPIALSKLQAALANLHVLAQLLSYILVPIALLALSRLLRDRRALPFLVYFAMLYAAMSFGFSYPGPLGAFLHSVVALMPFFGYAVALGLDCAVQALVKSRPHLRPATARRLCYSLLVSGQVVLTLALATVAVGDWNQRYSYQLYPAAIEWLTPRLGPGEPVMILDPPAYNYYSGRPAVVVPNDGSETLMALARRYGARYLLLEPAHTKPMDGLYQGRDLPAGVTPVLELAGARGKELKIYELR